MLELMNRGGKIAVGAFAVIMLFIAGSLIYFSTTSGLDSPLSVVMSSSMQHDTDESSLGTIDTGDVMIIRSPDRTDVYSYVEGTQNGYKSFGDYGSVLIYERGDDVNPVIHRAIVWLDYDSRSGFSAPSLANYEGKWNYNGTGDYMNMKNGTLTFEDITQSKKTVSIDLGELKPQSGYLTMGDNPVTNNYFDQTVGIISTPVGMEDIKAVAIHEIPWMGVIKVFMTPEKKDNLKHVPNSIYSLVMLFVMVFAIIYCCDYVHNHRILKENSRELEILREELY